MQYNKQFEYRGYKFNIKIEAEATIDSTYTMLTNCLGADQYYQKRKGVKEEELESRVEIETLEAKSYVDRKLGVQSPIIQRLLDTGFTRS